MSPRSAPKNGIVTALVYTRVSSEEQERDGLSLPSQLADCRQYASSRGWVIGAEFTDTMSGKRDDRPSYAALLAKARL
jgi:site-specific DNA recombinase